MSFAAQVDAALTHLLAPHICIMVEGLQANHSLPNSVDELVSGGCQGCVVPSSMQVAVSSAAKVCTFKVPPCTPRAV